MLVRKELRADGSLLHMTYRGGGYIVEHFRENEFGDKDVLEQARFPLRKDANAWMDRKRW